MNANRLDIIATVAILTTCGVLAWSALSLRHPTASAETAQVRAYAAGEQLDSLNELGLSKTQPTLILYLQSGCKYCTASAGFYRRLLAEGHRLPIVVVGLEPPEGLRAYLDGLQIHPDRLVSLKPGAFRLRGTPTILLVTPTGRVERVWRGQLRSASDEDELLRIAQPPSGLK